MKKLLKKVVFVLGITLSIGSPLLTAPILAEQLEMKPEFRVTDDIVLTDSEGNTYPVYEVFEENESTSYNLGDRLGNVYEHMNWTIESNDEEHTNSMLLGSQEKLYINEARWDAGQPIHLGITNGSKRYYSNLSSGSFNGYFTVKTSDTYTFYVKNIGYDTISFMGFITNYPW